ncbi:hypothetical protein BGX21_007768 [Mortierella sp. AD011]|nr:hypothetical protein BGX20_002609 [Mortierella sp. AD010]KAF9398462.1 hypothetical protein BGX21_007768 [Mortierella sp. AD011]
MSSADVIVPTMSSTVKPKRGLASLKTMFSSKRQSIAQIPASEESVLSSPEPALDSPVPDSATSSSSPQKAHGSVASLFTPNQKKAMEKAAEKEKKAMEKAAEKEKKEQVKQAIQLSDIDEQGAFLPPTPLEKGYKDNFKDNDEDFFITIINTPPERVRTFLSAASTISPGMFSQPSSKIKRHTLSSFPVTKRATLGSSNFMDMDLATATPPVVPPKDTCYSSSKPTKRDNQVQISYLTNAEDLSEALSESIGSLLTPSGPSTPTQEMPDLVEDSGSESSSPNASPRHSTVSFDEDRRRHREQAAKHEPLTESTFGNELPLSL